jgi:hypothetical protein
MKGAETAERVLHVMEMRNVRKILVENLKYNIRIHLREMQQHSK